MENKYPNIEQGNKNYLSTTIDGVKVLMLRKIPDQRGAILHGIRSDNLLSPFGEVYFKKLYKGIINGWHVHEALFLNLVCLSGMVRLVTYDLREKSPTYKKYQELYFGDDNYCLVHIPPTKVIRRGVREIIMNDLVNLKIFMFPVKFYFVR